MNFPIHAFLRVSLIFVKLDFHQLNGIFDILPIIVERSLFDHSEILLVIIFSVLLVVLLSSQKKLLFQKSSQFGIYQSLVIILEIIIALFQTLRIYNSIALGFVVVAHSHFVYLGIAALWALALFSHFELCWGHGQINIQLEGLFLPVQTTLITSALSFYRTSQSFSLDLLFALNGSLASETDTIKCLEFEVAKLRLIYLYRRTAVFALSRLVHKVLNSMEVNSDLVYFLLISFGHFSSQDF